MSSSAKLKFGHRSLAFSSLAILNRLSCFKKVWNRESKLNQMQLPFALCMDICANRVDDVAEAIIDLNNCSQTIL